MTYPMNKTKIVCTIGPASDRSDVLEQMIEAGMNIARLNFSHGDFAGHAERIERIRAASRATGRRVTIMADLPGPKMRVGELSSEPIELEAGDTFTLTTREIMGDQNCVSVTFSHLPDVVKPGDVLFLNDGLIQLETLTVVDSDVHCKVTSGGELRSRKGLNLPGIDLGIGAFTERDHECLRFAMEHGVDAVSQSFVETADDIHAVKQAASELGCKPFVIGKIERSSALEHIDAILEAADGIMIARGDLGVEIPIEGIAVTQKHLMRKANLLGKPVITATQMLESMTANRRPTRAESTDVANAILDGTDCVMLSGESAMGAYPVDSVAMLARIAAATEPTRPAYPVRNALMDQCGPVGINVNDLIAASVATTVEAVSPAAVIIPTRSGASARSVTRFRLPVWITAITTHESTCLNLQFSYGVRPIRVEYYPADWKSFARNLVRSEGVSGDVAILTEGPSSHNPDSNNRMEIIDLRSESAEGR